LPEDVLAALRKAVKKESRLRAAKILNQLVENARIAKNELIPCARIPA